MLTQVERPMTDEPTANTHLGEVWFRDRPGWALAVVVALFGAVLLLRLTVGSPVDAYSLFYALPVALAASAFGFRGGLSGGLVAVCLMAVWVVTEDVPLTPSGWISRVLPLLLLGALLGRAVDRGKLAEEGRRRADEQRRAAEEELSRAEMAAMLHRQAIEINDTLIQELAGAKWAFEAGRNEAGLDALTKAMRNAQELVSDLIRRADMGGRTQPTSWQPS
jgi:signal transduction histidine kinase